MSNSAPSSSHPPAGQPALALRLLIVEDHDDTSRALAFLLRNQGHTVTVANCAAQALELADAHHFDVVVSDIGLPDADGYDLMRELHARHQAKHQSTLKGIALSGYGQAEDLAKSKEAGFSHHVTKPVNMAHLARVLQEVAAR